jgi:heme-degrading monooxygenase HmoA
MPVDAEGYDVAKIRADPRVGPSGGKQMFARVSTYRTSPGTSGIPTEETVRRVLELPGCLGIQYMKGESDKSLSVTLWDSEENLLASQEEANKIRSDTSKEQHLEILEVEEYEVLTHQLKKA